MCGIAMRFTPDAPKVLVLRGHLTEILESLLSKVSMNAASANPVKTGAYFAGLPDYCLDLFCLRLCLVNDLRQAFRRLLGQLRINWQEDDVRHHPGGRRWDGLRTIWWRFYHTDVAGCSSRIKALPTESGY